jgi:hypothetical protein
MDLRWGATGARQQPGGAASSANGAIGAWIRCRQHQPAAGEWGHGPFGGLPLPNHTHLSSPDDQARLFKKAPGVEAFRRLVGQARALNATIWNEQATRTTTTQVPSH